jgi:hypothetical protein
MGEEEKVVFVLGGRGIDIVVSSSSQREYDDVSTLLPAPRDGCDGSPRLRTGSYLPREGGMDGQSRLPLRWEDHAGQRRAVILHHERHDIRLLGRALWRGIARPDEVR